MKTFIRGWEYEPPALQDFMGLVLILALIGTIVFKGRPVEDVLVGVFVLCVIVLIATNRSSVPMTPFRWVLSSALLVATLADYVVDTPVTHTVQRTVYWVLIVWFIANRPHIRQYWREEAIERRDAGAADSRL
jgi:hypothetical protein